MKLIPLTQGQFAKVDDEDFEWLNKWRWNVLKDDNTYYARRSWSIGNNKTKSIKMHRAILKVDNPKILVDHIDGDGLNNQKHNLRTCNHQQNSFNRRPEKNSHSKYLGVHPTIRKEPYFWARYYVKICHNGEHFRLGSFPYTEEGEIEAAKAYDKKAKELFGEFANLNFK